MEPLKTHDDKYFITNHKNLFVKEKCATILQFYVNKLKLYLKQFLNFMISCQKTVI